MNRLQENRDDHKIRIALGVGKLGSRQWLGTVGATSVPAGCVREAGIDANL